MACTECPEMVKVLCYAVILAGLIGATPGRADTDWEAEFPSEWWKAPPTDEEVLETLELIRVGLAVTNSPIMRQIACRVGYQPFSKDALLKALKVSEKELDKVLRKMRDMKLVRMRRGLVLPYGDYSAELLRRWSSISCVGDDECGVAK